MVGEHMDAAMGNSNGRKHGPQQGRRSNGRNMGRSNGRNMGRVARDATWDAKDKQIMILIQLIENQ